MKAPRTLATNATYAVSSPYYGWYVQDNWRINSKVSLNLGFRLEYELGRREREIGSGRFLLAGRSQDQAIIQT
jgi:hypothetical protein